MPIRPELRHFYRTPEWRAARRRVLTRAGGEFDLLGTYLGGACCEECGKPDRTKVECRYMRPMRYGPRMWWRAVNGSWRNWLGGAQEAPFNVDRTAAIRVVLAVVHLNHTPGDDRDANLKALCQWHHLNWDALSHKETRRGRKDKARPLLQEMVPSA